MADNTKTSAMIAKCRDQSCGYAWIIAFLPMNATASANLAIKCACPMCGDRKPLLGGETDLHPTLRDHLRAFAPLREPIPATGEEGATVPTDRPILSQSKDGGQLP